MPPPLPPGISQATQNLAACAVYAARNLAAADKADDEATAPVRGLMGQVTFENLKAFIVKPEVRAGSKSAAAVGASLALCHGIENSVAGTQALRDLGQRILISYPAIARILARNPNAALVAGTVAFPYVASPYFEKWFRTLLECDVTEARGNAHANWQNGFMATVGNWNHVQPALAAVLRAHPAVLALAAPLATGLIGAGNDVVNSLEEHRLGASGDASSAGRPTAGEIATGKAIASQTRYFLDAVRQAFKKNAHAPNLASEFITSNLYPGWVAAISNLYARDLAGRIHALKGAEASEPADPAGVAKTSSTSRSGSPTRGSRVEDQSPLNIAAMLDAPDGRELLAHLAREPSLSAIDEPQRSPPNAPRPASRSSSPAPSAVPGRQS